MKKRTARVIHAESPLVSGYTLCHITHEGSRVARIAKDGSRINCPNCRVVVNYCRAFGEPYVTPTYETVALPRTSIGNAP